MHNRTLNKAIVYSCMAINLVFVFTQMVNNKIYINYDVGYQVATFLHGKSQDKIFDYKVNSPSLEFHLTAPYQRLEDIKQLPQSGSYFLVIPREFESGIPNAKLVKRFNSIDQNKFTLLLFNRNKLNSSIKEISLLHFGDNVKLESTPKLQSNPKQKSSPKLK